jgi:hypothetical protein
LPQDPGDLRLLLRVRMGPMGPEGSFPCPTLCAMVCAMHLLWMELLLRQVC